MFIRNKFLLKHKYSDSVKHKLERGHHEDSTTAAVPQIQHVESAWRGLDSADFKWIFCEGEKCYACQFECDCSSGPQDCGWCVFGAIFPPDV
jgi:hypothetical protein